MLYVASELKALEGECETYEPFLPGHYYWSKEKKMQKWYKRDWDKFESVKDSDISLSTLRASLETAVQHQMMSDVPYGVLLSGGLDSSIISAITKKYAANRIEINNRSAAWGVEGRVPFLDKDFLEVAMRLNPELKMCTDKIEKEILRETFSDLLPESVVWRQKEQFSDGVGYSWIDTLKSVTETVVNDEQMAKASVRFPINTPSNKEEYYYRSIFDEYFPSRSAAVSVPHEASIACSTAIALEWDNSWKGKNEPSGRAVKDIYVSDSPNL